MDVIGHRLWRVAQVEFANRNKFKISDAPKAEVCRVSSYGTLVTTFNQ